MDEPFSAMKPLFRLSPASALLAIAASTWSCGRSERPAAPPSSPVCSRGFDSTFVQLQEAQLHYGYPEWGRALELFRSLGIRTIILQYSGDEHGPYEGREPGRSPIRSLLEAADDASMEVYLGLFAGPSGQRGRFDVTALAPPLEDPRASLELGAFCKVHRSCAGWYVPQEIDDLTWEKEPDRAALRDWLRRTSHRLRALSPEKPIALAPFYTGTLAPEGYAQFMSEILGERSVDIVILQDGLGAGHGKLESLGPMLRALRLSLEANEIRLWSVLELFDQLHGPPRDDLPFLAQPASFPRIREAFDAQRPHVERVVAFSVLDYMTEARGKRAALLQRQYRSWCGH